jgi:hypothetical protein
MSNTGSASFKSGSIVFSGSVHFLTVHCVSCQFRAFPADSKRFMPVQSNSGHFNEVQAQLVLVQVIYRSIGIHGATIKFVVQREC